MDGNRNIVSEADAEINVEPEQPESEMEYVDSGGECSESGSEGEEEETFVCNAEVCGCYLCFSITI